MKFEFLILLVFLLSCTSERILYQSEMKVQFNFDEFKRDLSNDFDLIGKKSLECIYSGSSEHCIGIQADSAVFVCSKKDLIYILSIYKKDDSRLQLSDFKKSKMSKYEKQSYKIHQSVISKISKKRGVLSKEKLGDFKEINKVFKK